MSKSSQAAEFVPRTDPTRADAGSDIAFAAGIAGSGVEGLRILATPPQGPIQESRSGAGGWGYFRITAPCPWRVEFHRLAKGAPEDGAEWVLTSATLTFTIPGAHP